MTKPRNGMQRHLSWTLPLALVLLVLAHGALKPLPAETLRVEWVQATCKAEPGVQWVTGKENQRLHCRGEVHHDVMMWPDGAPIGTNTIVFDFDLKLARGRGTASGTFNAWPSELAKGTWHGHFDGKIRNFLLSASLEGHGTGDLEGTKIRGRIQQFVPTEEQAAELCGGNEVLKAVRVTATIRDKSGD